MAMKTIFKRIVSFAAAAMLAIGASAASAAKPVTASAETTDAVETAANGVIYVETYYDSPDMSFPITCGTGFLVNDEYFITCNHVIDIASNEDLVAAIEYITGDDFEEDYVKIRSYSTGNTVVEATLYVPSKDFDYAICKLTSSGFQNRNSLTIGSAESVGRMDEVYALGYPADVTELTKDDRVATYTPSTVSITPGSVTNTNVVLEEVSGTLIESQAQITSGSSGGPLVNNKGEVVGIARSGIIDSDGNMTYYYVKIDEVAETLTNFGIDFTSAGSSPIDSESDSDPDSDPTPTETTTTAVTTTTTGGHEGIIDSSDDSSKSNDDNDDKDNTTTIIIICVIAAAVLIVAIILIIVLGKKKQPEPIPQQQLPRPSVPPQIPNGGYSGVPQGGANNGFATQAANNMQNTMQQQYRQPSSINEGTGDTTLLNVGAGETSVLGGGSMNRSAATLIRRKNGTNYSVNRPEFIIGKERNRVNCCINNNAVSRTHAKITNNGGIFFITDLNSSNYTYVNGEQIAPNDPKQLNNGDIIKLADEEFEFRV